MVPDGALRDMRRAMLYLALFGLGLLAADSGRNARVVVWSVLGVIVTICGAGLLSRLQPDLVTSTVDPFVAVFYRLDHPLGYWNALGALASLGAVLALGLAADPRAHVLLRAAAAGRLGDARRDDVPVALARRVARADRRAGRARGDRAAPGALAVTLAIVGATALLGVLRVDGYEALVLDPKAGSGQASQGAAFTRELVVLMLAAISAQVAVALMRGPRMLESHVVMLRRVAVVGGVAVVVLAAGVGYATKGSEAEGGVTKGTGWLDVSGITSSTRRPTPAKA